MLFGGLVLALFLPAPERAFADWTWTPDERLTNDPARSDWPSVAADPSGNVHVVWWDWGDGNSEIYYKRWNGTAWTEDERLTNAPGDSKYPRVAADPSGNVHVVWWDERDGNSEIYYKRWDGTEWTPDERLTNNASYYSSDPSVASDPSGNVHVVWHRLRDAQHYDIYYKRWDGTAWGPDEQLTGDPAANAWGPVVASDVSGNVHVVWWDGRAGGPGEIYYKRWDGVAWTPDERLTNNPADSREPAVATDPSGNVHVVWWEEQSDPLRRRIFYKRWDGVSWTLGQLLTNANDPASVAADPAGNVHVVWSDSRVPSDPFNSEIYYKRWNRVSWSADERLTNAPDFSVAPSMACDPSGNIHVVWQDLRDGNSEIYYKRGTTCLVPAPLPACRSMTSGLLFFARSTTDASPIPPGSPYFFDQTTVELTKEPGDHFYLSGAIDTTLDWICDDKVYVNGADTGVGFSGILDPTLPVCRPMEEVLLPVSARDITELIPDGTNCLEFKLADTQRGIYGNTAIYLYRYQDPFAVISAATDTTFYQNGVGTVQLTLVTRSNWGRSEDLHLAVDLAPSLGPVLHVGDDTFGLNPGEQHTTEFAWPVPDSSYAWEFAGEATLTDGAQAALPTFRYRKDRLFEASRVHPATVQEHQQRVVTCWTPQEQCQAQAIGIVLSAVLPSAGRIFSLSIAANDFCRAGVFAASGDGRRANAAFRGGAITLGKQLFLEALGALVEEGVPVLRAVRLLHQAGEYARNCMNGRLADYLRWIPGAGPGVPPGAVVDSLATWMTAGIDSTDAEVADALFLEGRCAVRIEADSVWTTADSLGLIFASVDPVDTLATIALTTPQVHSFLRTEAANPHSAATFRSRSLADQPLNVGVLHATADGERLFLRYAEFPVTDRTILTLNLADDQETFPLLVDLDGDGQTDEVRYPIGTAGQPESAAARRELQLFLNRPNPFNPTTVIAFVLPERGRAILSIYDAAGRLVARPFDRLVEPGRYELTWDGKTTGGSEAPSGVYFYRVESRGAERMRRMVLTK